MARLTQRRLGSQGGNALIEMAFVLPLLLVVFAGIVDFGLLFQRYEVLTNAVREGARVAVLPGYSPADVQARVTQYVGEGLGSAAAQAVTFPSAENGPITLPVAGGGTIDAYRVTASMTHTYLILGPIVSLVGSNNFGTVALKAQSTMRVEVGS